MSVTIYHNPRCMKSRETLQLLNKRGLEPVIVDYLRNPPTEAVIRQLLKKLGLRPRELLRSKEPEYKQSRLDNPAMSDADIIRAMVKHPKLIERPIVVNGHKAALGRPPENILNIL
jgi:arsenate reductase